MLNSTRIQILVLLFYIVAICRQPHVSGFKIEDCRVLNETANVTCYTPDKQQFNIDFSNEEHIKIYIFQDNESDTSTIFLTCQGSDEEVLHISDNLPRLLLERARLITIDGCLPFEGIFKRLGLSIGTQVKLQRGVTDVPLKREYLSSLTKVKSFLLGGFEALDEHVLADFQDLETLDLTRIETALPSGLLAPVSAHLTQLNMRENGMSMPTKGLFASLQQLDALDLSYNVLTTIPSGTFDQLYNLTVLDLSSNHLSHLPADAFKSLRKLKRLFLSYNRLQQLEPNTFATLSALQDLKLENNTLDIAASVACSIFDGLTSLEYLELNNNSISVYCLPNNMRSVSVDLSFNRLETLLLPPGESEPRQLVNLNVRHNQLQYLSDETLQYLHDSLAQLSLAHNPWQCDTASFLWLDFIKLNSRRILDLAEVDCFNDNAYWNVTLFKSSNVCKSVTSLYYIIAIAAVSTLAVAALIAAVFYKRKAIKRVDKLKNAKHVENTYENVGYQVDQNVY
ncbi:platelet glycoprotein V-like [Bactrocera neohumeralis]|uniref:platelet glycoprotein V-like n=1 Tax=Bactrocera neohumeralis TaxID=98809 RepID=UPI0021659D1A|nr:platelet glycoprotein V-like [Bactrocera neohumeralis]